MMSLSHEVSVTGNGQLAAAVVLCTSMVHSGNPGQKVIDYNYNNCTSKVHLHHLWHLLMQCSCCENANYL